MVKSPGKRPQGLLPQGLWGMRYYLDELLGRLYQVRQLWSKLSCSRETSKSCQAVVLFFISLLRRKVEYSAFALSQQESFFFENWIPEQEGRLKLFLVSYEVGRWSGITVNSCLLFNAVQ